MTYPQQPEPTHPYGQSYPPAGQYPPQPHTAQPPHPAHLYPPHSYPAGPPPAPPRAPKWRPPTWAIVVVAGALALCGIGLIGSIVSGDQDDAISAAEPAGESATPASQPPVEARQYDSVEQLRDAVEQAGHECTGYAVVAEPVGALERAECTYSTTLGIHSDQADAWASLDSMRFASDIIGERSVHLVGPNWTVNCGDDRDLCEDLQTRLGGEVDVYEPQ